MSSADVQLVRRRGRPPKMLQKAENQKPMLQNVPARMATVSRFDGLYKMDVQLQNVAVEIQKTLIESNARSIMDYYKVGNLVKHVIQHPDIFGQGALRQLSQYLNIAQAYLGSLARWAEMFDEDTVREYSSKPTSGNRVITLSHWLAISEIANAEARQKMLERIINENVSASDVKLFNQVTKRGEISVSLEEPENNPEDPEEETEENIEDHYDIGAQDSATPEQQPQKQTKQKRGRPVKIPDDPVIALQKFINAAARFNKYAEASYKIIGKFTKGELGKNYQTEYLVEKLQEIYNTVTFIEDNARVLLEQIEPILEKHRNNE